MFKKRIPKIIFVLTCILVLTMPDTLTLFAASLTHNDTTADLQISLFHQGGEEASDTLTPAQRELYDETQYVYNAGTTRVYKIIKKNDTEFENALYCLNAIKSFPGVTATGNSSLSYANVANFKESSDADIRSLYMSTYYSTDQAKWTENYNALTWLMNNIYLRNQLPKQKDAYLESAFANTEYELDTVKAILTDDDIDVVQQYAIWHFTNGDNEKYNVETLPAIRLTAMDPTNPTPNLNNTKSYSDIDEKYNYRQDMANKLYQYLIKSAKENKDSEETYPTIVPPANTKTKIEEGCYVAGPIKITQGNISDYTVKLVDKDNNELPKYSYYILADQEVQDKSLKELVGKELYIYIPITNNINGLKLTLDYKKHSTITSVWKAENDDEKKFQDVALITREEEPVHEEVEFKVTKVGTYNLELIKQDKETKAKLKDAEFNVQIGDETPIKYKTNPNGVLTIPTRAIESVGTDTIKITEIKAPEGYKAIEGTLELSVTKAEVGDEFVASMITTTNALPNTTAVLNNGKITVTVENEKIPEEPPTGSYEIEIVKVDKESKEVLEGAQFSVQINGDATRRYETNEDGIIKVPTIDILDVGKDIIKIKETEAPEGYKGAAGTIEIEASKVLNAGKYSISSISTTSGGNASASLSNGKITVTVENEKIPETPTVTGSYNIQIIKRDKTTDSILEGADFSVQIGNEKPKEYRTDEHGNISIPKIEIGYAGTHRVKIEEINAPDGYLASDGVLELTVTTEEINGKYVVTSFDSKRTDVDAEAFLEEDTIILIIRNQRIKTEIPEDPSKLTGKYEVYIEKIDQNKELITDSVARFTVNERVKSTIQGSVKIAEVGINSSNVNDIDIYEIKETKAPTGYTKFNGTIEVHVFKKLSKDEESYEIYKTILIVKDSEGNEISRGDNVQVYYENGIPKVVIKVVNFEKADLSLRKYISAVSKDETFEDEDYLKDGSSRVPKVDIDHLDNTISTTAKYNHTKAAVDAMKKDYILYNLRIYNEGNVNAYPTRIIDYLPEGIEFIADSEINSIWNYDEKTRKLTTNENYKPELLQAHTEGEELAYQELQIVCRVSEDVKEDTNIVNIAEIAEIKNEIGMIVEDRDSTPDDLNIPNDRSKYNGGTDNDKTDNYVPGQQDDDDFERIFVKSIVGNYDLEIVKVDENGKTIKNEVTKFTVNDFAEETKDGVVKLSDIRIDKTNAETPDKYIIKETKAPKGYTKLDDTIEVEVTKKFSDDGKSYIVDEVSIKGEKATIEKTEENGTTKIIVKVVNREQVDLSLRKYISAVSEDSNFEDKEYLSRAPIVDTKDLDEGRSTTAKYTHTKTAVKVKKGDYILYTIRVYNEGNIAAYASEVKDYLPEGLEFVTDSEINNIWNYDSANRLLTTNSNYEPKLLNAHQSGKDLIYQDLQVLCRVSENIREGVNIVNIAEISQSKYEDNTPAEDIDSTPDNLERPSDPSKYTGGKEDDEDYDRIYVEPEKKITGRYELTVTKVDSSNRIISSSKATFMINNEEKETINGKIQAANINITKDNVNEKDVYTIKEEKAPTGYVKFDGSIEVEVYKTLSDDRSRYEVSQATMVVRDADGNTYTGTDRKATISVSQSGSSSKIEIKVVNEKQNTPVNPPKDDPTEPEKPTKPTDPAKPEEPKKEEPKKEEPKQEEPKKEEPKKEEPKQEEPKKEEPKQAAVPDTGDMLPIIAVSVIGLVIIANIVYAIISKKKKDKEQ